MARKLIALFLSLFILIPAGCAGLPLSGSPAVYAETDNSFNGYSGVLSDLYKDPSFYPGKYPVNSKDYSISIIQIAESTAGELFLYTYQPSAQSLLLVASQVNMSLSESVDSTRLYSLSLLNSSGVFCKYRVDGVKKSSDSVRYYNITSLYRPWNASIDKVGEPTTDTNAVALAVGKLYKAEDTRDGVVYSVTYPETIEVLNPFVDFLEYSNGFWGIGGVTRSHYIAFNTDIKMDDLLEADVYFLSRKAISYTPYVYFKNLIGAGTYAYGDPVYIYETAISSTLTLQKGDTGSNNPTLFGKLYEYSRIVKSSEFIDNEKLLQQTENVVKNTSWVLRFTETSLTSVPWEVPFISDFLEETFKDVRISYDGKLYEVSGAEERRYTDISNVTILRLKYITGGMLYNLGAISNQVTGDDKPGNVLPEGKGFFEWLEWLTGVPVWIWKTILALLCLGICLPILSLIFPVFGQFLLLLFRGIWFIISFPFRLIKDLIDRKKQQKARSGQAKGKRRGR